MSDFNFILLVPAAFAVLLFALLAAMLAKRTQGRGLEAPDPRPATQQTVLPFTRVTFEPPPLIQATDYSAWRLIARHLANADSAGGPLYRLRFVPEDHLPNWQAGAIAQVYCGQPQDVLMPGGPAHAPVGQYMIGSLPGDGTVELVVRLVPHNGPDGGRRSRWLCEEIQTGQQVALAISDDPAFGPPPDEVPLILIGNATGIAGLFIHLKARPLGTRNWLILGDRNSADDQVLATEIAGWVSTGHLERCDLVLPGEGQEQRHVTDQIEDAKMPLLDWVLAGSAIYVCGSRLMGEDVDATLDRLLGGEVLEAMVEAGLYRRLVY